MFRNLCMLRKKVLMSRVVYSSFTGRANFLTSSKFMSKPTDDSLKDEITVCDINIHELAQGDVEFTRNFLTSFSALERCSYARIPFPDDDLTMEASPTPLSDAPAVEDMPASGGSSSEILDKDGVPIVPIEIDGWKNAEGEPDEEGPTVQNPAGLDIGDDEEYKKENLLVVPEQREGQFEYKGIKVKLPEQASKDIGTYRFRRDKEDLETVADDMRVAKFDKK